MKGKKLIVIGKTAYPPWSALAKLPRLGYAVHYTHSLDTAIEAIDTESAVDLLIIDLSLPELQYPDFYKLRLLANKTYFISFFDAAKERFIEQLADSDIFFSLIPKKPKLAELEALLHAGLREAHFIKEAVTERAMRHAEGLYRESFLQSSAIKLLVEPKSGSIIEANQAAADFYGYDREQLKTMSVKDLNVIAPEAVEKNLAGISSKNLEHFEVQHRLASGEIRDVEVFSSPISMDKHDFLHSIVHDVTEKKKAGIQLEHLVKEKELLMKELQHRVKNNLNVVSGLLGLEEEKCRDPEARQAFSNAAARVGAIAEVYEKLYASPNLDSIDMAPYVEELIENLFSTYNLDPERIHLKTSLESLSMDMKRCVPLGLILNELLTNALKYAYPESQDGEVRVRLEKQDRDIWLSIEDDGQGVPEEFRGPETDSMGMTIVRMLAEQLGGDFRLDCRKGTKASIRFPA